MSKILVLVEHKDGALKNYSKELLSQARKVAADLNAELNALCFSEGANLDLSSEAVSKVFVGQLNVDQSSGRATSEILDKVIQDEGVTHVFATSTKYWVLCTTLLTISSIQLTMYVRYTLSESSYYIVVACIAYGIIAITILQFQQYTYIQ